MARPESINDIELKPVEFATVQVDNIASNGTLLKAYAVFMEAVQKAGVEVEVRYNAAHFTRQPTDSERRSQLESEQMKWDESKKYYDTLAAVGKVEYSYQETLAEAWAKKEGLPFPPEHEPISDFDAVIRGIDEVTA